MTYEEAHKYLEDLQREFTLHRQVYADNLIQANGVAILAIEKQIPKKPKIITTSERVGLQEMICPLCHKFFGEKIKGDAILFHTPKYCERCGQALDWSEEK